ncbi:MAG TPA: PAS domain-containing sensor histidine kinase [Kiritimatiellae bacterium]|nr:PAS domain-containing sensor histidine kinase [Kiritimatiellia bacterium]
MNGHREKIPGAPDLDSAAEALGALMERAGDVCFRLDLHRRHVVWLNGSPERVLGITSEDRGFSFDRLEEWIHPDDLAEAKLFWETLLSGRSADIEVRARTTRERWQWLYLLAVPYPVSDTPRFMLGLVRDTQRYHQAERQALEEIGRQRIGTLAEGLAHEFNNLLTPIRGFIELALDGFKPEDPIADGLKTALGQVERCAQLVNQIQLCGRKSFVTPEEIRIDRMIPTVARVALSSHRGTGKRYRLKLEWPEKLPPLLADRIQLQEAVVQLIRNAVEAMPEGGTLTIRAEPVRVSAREAAGRSGTKRTGTFMRIDVTDSGMGMSAEVLQHAMDPFFTTHSRAGKRGMGLPIVRGMAEQNGGWLELDSRPGQGTRATLYLPMAEHAHESLPPDVVADEDGTLRVLPAAPVGRALVGDDDDLVRELVARTLESEGWHVKTVDGFDKVMGMVRKGCIDFDVAVLDLTMAGGTITDVLHQLRESAAETAVILVSGFGYDDLVGRLVRAGGGKVSYMPKPFSPKELLQRIDKLLIGTGKEEEIIKS